MYSYDSYGWLSAADIPGRQTDIAPPAHGDKIVGQPYPNWAGFGWVLVNYYEPPADAPTPLPKPPISGVSFLRRFTSPQRIAIRALAKADPIAEDFMYLLDATISQGSLIDLADPDTVAGVHYLAAALPGSGIDPAIILE